MLHDQYEQFPCIHAFFSICDHHPNKINTWFHQRARCQLEHQIVSAYHATKENNEFMHNQHVLEKLISVFAKRHTFVKAGKNRNNGISLKQS